MTFDAKNEGINQRPDDLIAAVLADHAQIKSMFQAVLPSASSEARKEAFDSLVRKLAVHETAEEEVVHPLARQASGGDAVADARLHEEDEAKSLLSELESMGVDAPGFNEKLESLRLAVTQHATNEEQQEFPLLEQSVSKERLQQLEKAFRAAEATAPTHPHPHGPESALGNLVVGPTVALADRVRDVVREALKKIGR